MCWNRVYGYTKNNGILISISILQYYVLQVYGKNLSSYSQMLLLLANTITKNFLLLNMVNFIYKKIKPIEGEKRIVAKEKFKYEFASNVVIASIMESVVTYNVKKLCVNNNDIYNDLLMFIPVSFVFELIFDFFHYTAHRYMHVNKFLYKYCHKKHHKFSHPTPILAFYQDPFDLLLSNTLPTYVTAYIMTQLFKYNMSFQMFLMINTYKTFTEITGHAGKEKENASICGFIQCIWLPKIFNIGLFVRNHDLHHTQNNCNYSKRFSIWDKLFGTFIDKKNQ